MYSALAECMCSAPTESLDPVPLVWTKDVGPDGIASRFVYDWLRCTGQYVQLLCRGQSIGILLILRDWYKSHIVTATRREQPSHIS